MEGKEVPQDRIESIDQNLLDMATKNYETFHSLPEGSATIEQVSASNVGLEGWANWQNPET